MKGSGGRKAGGGGGSLAARRRLSRELALQLLFQRDLSGGPDDELPGLFKENFAPDRDAELSLGVSRDAFEAAWPGGVELYLGIVRTVGELDEDIAAAARNWRLDRMGAVDRALIRLAYFEMRYQPDVPVKTSLNEAVELAKGFGNSDSQAFVNGVLDRLAKDLPARQAAPAPADSATKKAAGGGDAEAAVVRDAEAAGAGEAEAATVKEAEAAAVRDAEAAAVRDAEAAAVRDAEAAAVRDAEAAAVRDAEAAAVRDAEAAAVRDAEAAAVRDAEAA
ncbi:MAG: transcription antitermination factor NusB, partial [Deltaproteobacteria bacterium]|nr:transcription antitermination factor NusB [Deltaproteobacteria bacterium]